jgi:hypothetical protein
VTKRATALLVLGLLQMSGHVLELAGLPKIGRPLRALGAATAASPAPKVFSTASCLETFSTRFTLEWRDVTGRDRRLRITPDVGARIHGPYNRRNVFGAAIAFGPVLETTPETQRLFRSIASHALCGEASLLRELGIDVTAIRGPVRVRYEPVAGTDLGNLPTVIETPCR